VAAAVAGLAVAVVVLAVTGVVAVLAEVAVVAALAPFGFFSLTGVVWAKLSPAKQAGNWQAGRSFS